MPNDHNLSSHPASEQRQGRQRAHNQDTTPEEGKHKASLVAYVLTLNEERHIVGVMNSLKRLGSKILVVDSLSTDRTVSLAEANGAIIWRNEFVSWATQHNWALDKIERELQPDWVLGLDADERLSDELVDEIHQVLTEPAHYPDIYLIPRRLIFGGRPLRFGFGAMRLPRLLRPGAGRYEDRDINPHLVALPKSRYATFKGAIIHEDVTSWEHFIAKHNLYSTREARARFELKSGQGKPTSMSVALSHPQLRRRWMRETIFNRLPAKPALRFLEIYILRGGFLDGRAGFRIAALVSVQEWFTDLKHRELRERPGT